MGHFLSSRGVDEVRHEVAHRIGVDRQHAREVEGHRDEVRALALFEGPADVVHADGSRAFDRGHAQRSPGRHDLRILVLDLVEQADVLHLVDDVVAVVAGRLVGTEAAVAARFLEDHGRADDAVDDADGSRVDDHAGAALRDDAGLVVVAVGQVDRDQVLIEDAQFVEELRRSLAVSLDDLVRLSVALLHVQVHLGVSFLDGLLGLEQHLGAHEVGALRAEQDADVALAVPAVVGLDVRVHLAFAHLVVELIELAGIIDPSLGGAEHGGQVASRADLRDEFRAAVHFDVVVAEAGRAGLDGLDDGHAAALDLVLGGRGVHERLQREHHPVVGVLRQASEHVVERVHVGVDQSREDDMILQIQHFVRLIFAVYCRCVGKAFDLACVYDHGDAGFIPYALALHGVEMRGFYDHVNFFHTIYLR